VAILQQFLKARQDGHRGLSEAHSDSTHIILSDLVASACVDVPVGSSSIQEIAETDAASGP
jgi:hypothetical protein